MPIGVYERRPRPLPDRRVCKRCGLEQPIAEFSPNPKGWARRWICQSCYRKAARERPKRDERAYYAANRQRRVEQQRTDRAANRERYRERQRQWAGEHPDAVREQKERWTENNPERWQVMRRGQSTVANALRVGVLQKPDACEQCGATGVRIEAAHADYSKPLEVRWLCVPCHRQWDADQPKSISAPSELLTSGQASALLGVNKTSLVSWAKAGWLPSTGSIPLGRHTRFDAALIERMASYLASHATRSTRPAKLLRQFLAQETN